MVFFHFLITTALQHVASNPIAISGALLAYLQRTTPELRQDNRNALLRKIGEREREGFFCVKCEDKREAEANSWDDAAFSDRSEAGAVQGRSLLWKECNQPLGGNGGGKQMDEMGGGEVFGVCVCVGSGGDSRYSMRLIFFGAVLQNRASAGAPAFNIIQTN